MEKHRICLGTIATAHGVKGLVKIKCHAEDPQLLNGALYTAETGQETLDLTMKNSMGKYWLATVEGINDRDAALALRGTKLWIDREQLPEIAEEDEFYLDDLVGLNVKDTNSQPAGEIIAVNNFGAGDLLEIKPPHGPSYYLPFTMENVPEVSLDQNSITITAEARQDD